MVAERLTGYFARISYTTLKHGGQYILRVSPLLHWVRMQVWIATQERGNQSERQVKRGVYCSLIV